jgi:hypothetical protein
MQFVAFNNHFPCISLETECDDYDRLKCENARCVWRERLQQPLCVEINDSEI